MVGQYLVVNAFVSPRPYPYTSLKMSSFGCENNSLKTWIESTFLIKTNVKKCIYTPLLKVYSIC